MNLYDECFSGVQSVLEQYGARKLEYNNACDYPEADKNQIIFQNDTAYELGGGTLPAVSSIALTDKKELVPRDEILLIGRDLFEIKENSPFARIALIRVCEDEMGTGEKLYATVRKIEYARYHINPEGYMMRISAFTHREAARVGKSALVKGISFTDVGSLFINEYKKNQQVEAVKLLFVTEPDFPYDRLEAIMQKSEDITKALDHIMKNIKMDCDTCSLKAVCEEVEALCDKDFPKN
ncbi:MAG: carbon monoxide dehydrogenase [Ruminococcaceae bacterium]|nr:carbon monoxide dehydrogenase [Oscillospiraceae bacterium]